MGLLGATLLLLAILTAVVFGLAALRSRFHDGGREDAESQRRMLVANWDAVERAAQGSGMSVDEIAEVRRRVFGA